jgi:hypothetical protein
MLLMELYRTADRSGARIHSAESLERFFDLEYYRRVGALDLRLTSYRITLKSDDPLNWGQVISEDAKQTLKPLRRVLRSYGHVFDVDFYERLVRFGKSTFFQYAPHFPDMLRRIDPQEYRSLEQFAMTDALKDNVVALGEAIDAYNELAAEDQRIDLAKLWESFFTGTLARVMEARNMNAQAPQQQQQQQPNPQQQNPQQQNPQQQNPQQQNPQQIGPPPLVDRFDMPFVVADSVTLLRTEFGMSLQFEIAHFSQQLGQRVRLPVARVALSIDGAQGLQLNLAAMLAQVIPLQQQQPNPGTQTQGQ